MAEKRNKTKINQIVNESRISCELTTLLDHISWDYNSPLKQENFNDILKVCLAITKDSEKDLSEINQIIKDFSQSQVHEANKKLSEEEKTTAKNQAALSVKHLNAHNKQILEDFDRLVQIECLLVGILISTDKDFGWKKKTKSKVIQVLAKYFTQLLTNRLLYIDSKIGKQKFWSETISKQLVHNYEFYKKEIKRAKQFYKEEEEKRFNKNGEKVDPMKQTSNAFPDLPHDILRKLPLKGENPHRLAIKMVTKELKLNLAVSTVQTRISTARNEFGINSKS